MVRLLSTCVVLVLVATLILDCEALFRRLRPNKFCCVRRRCTVGSRIVRCCGRRRVCVGKRGFRKGHCRRINGHRSCHGESSKTSGWNQKTDYD
ncbi:hypothetical protein ACOMHN_052102 [Nucella lapillus]